MSNVLDTTESSAATAKVFVTAFKSLPSGARREILLELLIDEKLREDVTAALLWEERKNEPRRSFREYLSEHSE